MPGSARSCRRTADAQLTHLVGRPEREHGDASLWAVSSVTADRDVYLRLKKDISQWGVVEGHGAITDER